MASRFIPVSSSRLERGPRLTAAVVFGVALGMAALMLALAVSLGARAHPRYLAVVEATDSCFVTPSVA